jgi:hypothetical protein
MHFFCTKEHYERWTGKQGCNPDDIFCLDLEEALAVAEMLFKMT